MQILKAQLVQQSQTNDKETGERVKAPVVKKEVKEEEKPVIEKLPYTPGVLLKFTSQTTDVKKKDVRVGIKPRGCASCLFNSRPC